MGVDKVLEIDLSQLTQEGANQLVEQFDDIIKNTPESKGKTSKIKQKIQENTNTLKNLNLGNLLSFGKNPIGFIGGFATKLVPFLAPALLATGAIAAIIKKIDDFQKKFIDTIDDRITLARSKENQARIQAGLDQLIITTSAGSTEPRDAYNTFREFNENQSRIETDFQIRNTSGVD